MITALGTSLRYFLQLSPYMTHYTAKARLIRNAIIKSIKLPQKLKNTY